MKKILSVIYQIKNTKNSKKYIGSSVNYKNRRQEHFRDLLLNKHHSIALQRAYNTYGKESFVFEIIEFVENKKELITREQFHINNFKPEYNCCKIAGSRLGSKMTLDQIKENSKRNSGEKNSNAKLKEIDVLKIIELRETSTIKRIALDYDVSVSTISRILNNRSFKNVNIPKKNYKKLYPDVSKKRLSDLAKNRKNSSKIVIDLNTGVFYDSITELSNILQIKIPTLIDRINLKYNPLPRYNII